MKAYDTLWGYRAGDQWDGYFTRLYRSSRDSLFSLGNGFTAYAVLSPGTNSSYHRRCRLEAETIRLDLISHRQLGTSNGCRDHTVLPYATSAVRPARREPLTSRKARPAITLRADAAASTASHLAFVTMANAPLGG